MITDKPDKQVFQDYYKNLDGAEKLTEKDLEEFFVYVQEKQVQEEDKEHLESTIQLLDIDTAINGLKFNRAPWTSGFTAEFYKKI